jgi:hypothetical protein
MRKYDQVLKVIIVNASYEVTLKLINAILLMTILPTVTNLKSTISTQIESITTSMSGGMAMPRVEIDIQHRV